RVDVDSPDDVAGDYTVALEGRTGDRRGDAVDLVRQRRVEPLNRFLDEEHAGVGVVEVPHRTVRPVPGVLLDTEVGVIRERSTGYLCLRLLETIGGDDIGQDVEVWDRINFGHVRILPPFRCAGCEPRGGPPGRPRPPWVRSSSP